MSAMWCSESEKSQCWCLAVQKMRFYLHWRSVHADNKAWSCGEASSEGNAHRRSRKTGRIDKKLLFHNFFLRITSYFLALDLASFTGFIGTLQHIKSHEAHPQALSTTTTSPHFSHLYFSPFFVINIHLP